MSCELRVASWELGVTSYELSAWYDLCVTYMYHNILDTKKKRPDSSVG